MMDACVGVSSGLAGFVYASDSVRGSCSVGPTLRVRGNPAALDVAADSTSSVCRDQARG